jgi:hypothetical protein
MRLWAHGDGDSAGSRAVNDAGSFDVLASRRDDDVMPEASETLKRSMREIYNACSRGGSTAPENAIVNGGVLNQALGVTEYDPHEAYFVTKNGITLIEE